MLLFGTLARGDEATERRREQLLAQMRGIAEETSIKLVESDRDAAMVKSPIFRYDDQPRRFIDATIWAWTDGGRPVAFQKVEASIDAVTNLPKWGFCFASLAEERLAAEWGHGKTFRSTEAGVTFRPMPDAPAVAERNFERKRQARDLARGFSARILLDPRTNSTEQMRLLSTPLFEYEGDDSEAYQGAVYGYSTSGRNPDLLVVFEARETDKGVQWHYAPARMTIGGVTLKHGDRPVWEVSFIEPRPQDFPTWTFFYRPREPVAGEEAP